MAHTCKVSGGTGHIDPDSDDDCDVEICAAVNMSTGQKAVSYKHYATELTRTPPTSTYPHLQPTSLPISPRMTPSAESVSTWQARKDPLTKEAIDIQIKCKQVSEDTGPFCLSAHSKIRVPWLWCRFMVVTFMTFNLLS